MRPPVIERRLVPMCWCELGEIYGVKYSLAILSAAQFPQIIAERQRYGSIRKDIDAKPYISYPLRTTMSAAGSQRPG